MGPPPLIAAAAKAHSFLVFTVPSSLQRAVAYGLDHEESFYRRVMLTRPPEVRWTLVYLCDAIVIYLKITESAAVQQ